MQTRQYKDLFALSTHLIGAVELVETEQDQLASFINRRYFEAFRKSPVWPRYLVGSEARDIISLTISGLGAGSSTDSSSVVNGNYILLGQEDGGTGGGTNGTNIYYNPATGTRTSGGVSSTTVIYKRASTSRWEIEINGNIAINADGTIEVQGGTGTTVLVESDSLKKDNPSEVDGWTLTAANVSGTPLIVDEQFIPYAQTGKDSIGDFQRIHRQKAFLNNSVLEYDFFVDFNGAKILNIVNSNENVAYATYKKQFAPFTVNSDYYNSTVEVPSEFFNYIAHAAYADFLTLQGKVELAQAESIVAEKYLDLELEKLSNINSTNTLSRISTHLSRQSRN
jgi:hypothetical protein